MNSFDLNDPRLTAYALGELPESERLAVEQWLEESAGAQAALLEIQETINLVKDELAAEPAPALTTSQRQAIEAQLATAPAVSPVATSQPVTVATVRTEERASLSWRWLSLGLTTAALVGIALVLPRDERRQNLERKLARNDGEVGTAEVAMSDQKTRALGDAAAAVPVDESKPFDELVVDYNKAYQARDFVTSAAIAKRAKQIDPENPVSVEMELKARFAARNESNKALRETNETLTWSTLDDVESALAKTSIDNSSPVPEHDRRIANKPSYAGRRTDGGIDAQQQTPSAGLVAGAGAPTSAAKSELTKDKQVASLATAASSEPSRHKMKIEAATNASPTRFSSTTNPADRGSLGGEGAPAPQASLAKGAVNRTASREGNAPNDRLQAGVDKPFAAGPMPGKRMEGEAKSKSDQSREYASKNGEKAPQSSDGAQKASGAPAGSKPASAATRKTVLFADESRNRTTATAKAPGTPKTEAEVAKLMQARGAVPAAGQPEAKDASASRALAGRDALALRDSDRKKLEEKLPRGIDAYNLQKESRDQAPNAEAYEPITENEFLVPQESPLSTFSIDVDSASYANMRRFLTGGQLPPPNAIRIEELVNYFSYQYAQPADGQPFSVLADAAPCPWSKDNYIARIGLKARDIDKSKRPPTNLVFLIDVSGSMATTNKLPLVKRGMSLLVEEMTEIDRISIVTYAGDAGLKLEPTTGNEQARIMNVIDGLNAGGSTNGAAGINLAYEQALRNFNKDAANRVILCTDGDFNVGVSNDDELVKLIQAQAKTGVYLSIFGFGMGNLKDSKLEKLADKGNGHYGYIDDLNEARKVFNEELVGTLYTVAKDVKLQVEFNPLTVGAYRLIGYENRTLAAQDFNDDTKDAGEIGAGHTVTALYEIVPVGKWPKPSGVDPLKYAAADKAADRKLAEAKDAAKKVPADVADDLFTVKLRYKLPDAETSVKTIDYVVDDITGKKITPSSDLMWAASVANFGMQLRHSKHAGNWTLDAIAETAGALVEGDRTGRRTEFVELVKKASELRTRK
mgnify:CR=1 FL=1